MKPIPKLFNYKLLLTSTSLLYLICGIVLTISGYLLFMNSDQIILSKLLQVTNERLSELSEPLFYYVSLGLTLVGLVVSFSAIIGCWTIYGSNNYCTLSIYFLIVFILLVMEFVLSILITLWPQCLGLIRLDEEGMVKELQGKYGVPGHEIFTAAMDLAQSSFNCCAISSDINYDTSLWRLQSFGNKDFAVPLTCCLLSENSQGYLDPTPINLTQCQSLQKSEYSKGRHLKSCLNKIESWYKENYIQFLCATGVVAVVQFFVIISIIINCSNIKRRRSSSIDRHIVEFEKKLNDRRYFNTNSSLASTPDIREVYIQPPDLYKHKQVTTFRPPAQNYHKSYLV